MSTENSFEEHKDKALSQIAVMRSFLDEISQKHNVPIERVVVGIIFNKVNVWDFNQGCIPDWILLETLEQ
jgi:hypothetical protein